MKRINTTCRLAFLLIACTLLLPSTALANPDLTKMDLGSYVTGPKITMNDLPGRFVIVEYWGVNCPPCIASIPHMSKLAKEYGHDKLLIIANHAQSASDAQVKEKWESRAKSNHVAVINRGNLPGAKVSGIPDVFLFAPNGKYLWNGRPSGVDKALEQAVKQYRLPKREKEEAPKADPIVTGVETKFFSRQLEEINEQKRSIDAPLIQLRRTLDRSKRDDQVAEAKAILDAVQQWIDQRSAAIDSSMQDDPAASHALIEATMELLGRDESAKAFTALHKQMEADDKLMDRVRSTRMLREVIAEAESIGLTTDATKANSDRKNTRTIRGIARDLGKIIKTWPETDAAKQAEGFRKSWSLEG
ncbi:MAG: TlpA disulfide reductase family protein [Phycisphaeraceae bacterium]